jgi:hypothetical protein
MGRMKSIWMCWILYTYKRKQRQKAIAIAWVHQGQCQLYNNPPPPPQTLQSNLNHPNHFRVNRRPRRAERKHKFPIPISVISKPSSCSLSFGGCNLHLCWRGFRLFVRRFSSRISTPRLLVGPTLKDVCKQKHAIWTGSMASSSSSTKPIFVYPAVYTLCDVASSCLTSFTASAFGCRSSSSSSSIT